MAMIATSADCAFIDVQTSILEKWAELEDLVKPHYDVFENDPRLRQLIQELIRLLYYADPKASAAKDCKELREKNALYGGSWCKRGGSGAFHMVARKFDRYQEQIRLEYSEVEDTIGDARRYLILIDAWHLARSQGLICKCVTDSIGTSNSLDCLVHGQDTPF